MLKIIAGIARHPNVSEEILQDTFVKIWQNAIQYDANKGRLFTWMARIARNTAIDRVKTKKYNRQQRTPGLDDLDGLADKYGEEQVVPDSGLRKVVNSMKPKHRQLIDYLYFRDYTQKETSVALDMPLGTVKTEIRKAIMHLRQLLAQEK